MGSVTAVEVEVCSLDKAMVVVVVRVVVAVAVEAWPLRQMCVVSSAAAARIHLAAGDKSSRLIFSVVQLLLLLGAADFCIWFSMSK